MAFPGLYSEVAHVSTEPTTVPTAAVLTHVLHLLMYLCCGGDVGARYKCSVLLTCSRDALGADYVVGNLCGCGKDVSSKAVSPA